MSGRCGGGSDQFYCGPGPPVNHPGGPYYRWLLKLDSNLEGSLH